MNTEKTFRHLGLIQRGLRKKYVLQHKKHAKKFGLYI